MLLTVVLTIIQVLSDLCCCLVALYCGLSKQYTYRQFFLISSVAFFFLGISDIYYNLVFRMLQADISRSIDFIVTSTMFIFQISQAYCWRVFSKVEKFKIASFQNLPYILFSAAMIFILVYYVVTSDSPSVFATWYQSMTIAFDMLIWFYAIVCLSRTRSFAIILLALGSLVLFSASLTTRCLFMLDMSKVIPSQWIHIVWTFGVAIMAVGFMLCLKRKKISFCLNNSIQIRCCSWLSITSLIVFLIGFTFLSLLEVSQDGTGDLRSLLWGLPVALVFTMIISVLLGNWFSRTMLLPISHFLERIAFFNEGFYAEKNTTYQSEVHEFKLLGEFIDDSFYKLSCALDNEVKLAAQVAHDIRTPLASLEVIIKRLSGVDEEKKVMLSSAVSHIGNIVNNLERTVSSSSAPEEERITQIAVMLESILLERKASLRNEKITFDNKLPPEAFSAFVEVVPSVMRRVLENIINNSCEAIGEAGGVVQVGLKQVAEEVIITITDTGPGVPEEARPFIFDRGYTTKKEGSGLGLHNAKENINRWHGSICLESSAKRTELTIGLPSQSPPKYFIGQLQFLPGEQIIVVDDSINAWHMWKYRLSFEPNLNISYCCSLDALRAKLPSLVHEKVTFLVDYEFPGEQYTGLNIVNEILSRNINSRICIVTSCSDKSEVKMFCLQKQIYLLPKSFISKIAIQIGKEYVGVPT